MNEELVSPDVITSFPVPSENPNNLPREQITTMTMLQTAIERGASIDQMDKLMQLHERWETNEARKAYVVAMSRFKADPPQIFKDQRVLYKTSKGTTDYTHASLGHVSGVISARLAEFGLSNHWDIEQIDGGQIKVTCVITHEQGHSERVPLQSGADQSGGKNNIQAIGSTTTYLQRYTLLSATGLATKDMDDDGIGYVDDNVNSLPEYPSEKFEKNFQTWENMIHAGKKTASQIIDTVSSIGQLTEAQINKISGCKVGNGDAG